MIAPALLLLTVAAVLVDCRPQGARSGPSIFSQLPSTTSQPFFQGNQGFSTQNQVMPAWASTDQPTESVGRPMSSTLPPRDRSYRLVYTIPINCRCPFLPQYNPVCGSDGRTYGNFGILDCHKQCGFDIDLYLEGACPRSG